MNRTTRRTAERLAAKTSRRDRIARRAARHRDEALTGLGGVAPAPAVAATKPIDAPAQADRDDDLDDDNDPEFAGLLDRPRDDDGLDDDDDVLDEYPQPDLMASLLPPITTIGQARLKTAWALDDAHCAIFRTKPAELAKVRAWASGEAYHPTYKLVRIFATLIPDLFHCQTPQEHLSREPATLVAVLAFLLREGVKADLIRRNERQMAGN